MKNKIGFRQTFTVFTLLSCASIFPLTAIAADADNVSGDGVAELRLREDASVREVNEEASEEIEKIKAARKTRYIDEELGYVPDNVNLISSDDLSAIEKQRAGREKAIRARFVGDINALEQPTASQQIETRPLKPAAVARGTVTGIVLYNNKGAALIAGKIVRENETIQGVKVVRILADYVEFEKQGKTWKQGVGQAPPGGVWEGPSAPAKQAAPAQQPATAPKGKPER